jgi:hypothetical protein
VRSITNAKLLLVTAAVLVMGLVTAGAAMIGSSATRPASTALPAAPPRDSRRTVAQAPAPPAAARTDTATGPIVVRVEVVDEGSHRLPGVDVGVSSWYRRGEADPTTNFQRATSDEIGEVEVEIAREGPAGTASVGYVWAYQPGRSVAVASVSLARPGSVPLPVRLTLYKAVELAVTAVGPDNRPIVGLRVAPSTLRLRRAPRRSIWFTVPDEWADRLAVTTDAKGSAMVTCVADDMELLAVRVAGPDVASHALPVNAALGKCTIKLGPRGRLVGIVRSSAGQPLADVPVQIWVQGSGSMPNAVITRSITPDERLEFGGGPLKTGPQGLFQTPATLLSGSTYRISIKQEGYVPFLSDWVTLGGERATISPIRLEPLR